MIILIIDCSGVIFEIQHLKNGHYNFSEPKVTSWNCFFCLTNSPKPTYSLITAINEKEQQQILRFKKLEPAY